MPSKQILSRRGFLVGASAATVAGAAALVAAPQKTGPVLVKTSKASVEPGQGYQLSAHVRSYYRTTSI